MPRKTRAQRRTDGMIANWSRHEQHDRNMAAQYRKAARTLREEGREDDAAFLEMMADQFSGHAATARAIMAGLQAQGV